MKKTTRISALIMIMALLMNLFGAAFAESEGILLEDLDVSAYQMLLSGIERATEAETCDGVECGFNEFAEMTGFERGNELAAMYEASEYEAFIEHVKTCHPDTNKVCLCEEYNPETHRYGTGSHKPDCLWNINFISIEDLAISYIWEQVSKDEDTCSASIAKIGFVDKGAGIIEFVDDNITGSYTAGCYVYPVFSKECPDYLILDEEYYDENGNVVLYYWDSFDYDFLENTLAGVYGYWVPADAFTKVVNYDELAVTLKADASTIVFYDDVAGSGIEVSVEELGGAEFDVVNLYNDYAFGDRYVQLDENDLPASAAGYTWVKYESIGELFESTSGEEEEGDITGGATDTGTDTDLEILVPEGAFGEGISVIINAIAAEITDGIKAAISALGNYRIFSCFDISFANKNDTETEIQPESGKHVNLTFTVPTHKIKAKTICVFHMKDDGTAEIVGEKAVDRSLENQTITVEATSFSEYGVAEYLPKVGTCDDFGCDAYFANCTTPLARFTYVMGDLFDEGNTAETFMLHLVGDHYEELFNFCFCSTDILMLAPGHSAHEADCVWSSANVSCSAEELKAAYDTLDIAGSTYFLLACDNTQREGIRGLLDTDEEKAAFDFYVSGGNGLASWLIDENEDNGIKYWVVEQKEVEVTPAMVERAYEVEQKLDAEGKTEKALDMLHVEESELVSVYYGSTIADIVEVTGIKGITAKLVDRSMGLTVAYVNTNGEVVPVDEVETTNE